MLRRRSVASRPRVVTIEEVHLLSIVPTFCPKATMPAMSSEASRPLLQFSLRSLLLAVTSVALALAFYRLAGPMAIVHYCFLLFAVGPWFAYLVAECLPLRAVALRTAVANVLLLVLFIGTLYLAEATLEGPVSIVVGLTALLLWTPQYLICFVWRMAD